MNERIEILYPEKYPRRPVRAKVWYASGTVSHNIPVLGTLWTADGTTKKLDGTTILYDCTRRRRVGRCLHRWLIKFVSAGNLDGRFLLRVAWTNDETVKDERIVTLAPAQTAFQIVEPENSEDITPYADAFVAWGTLEGDTSVMTATMFPSTGDPVPGFVNNDPENDSWSAMFPSLEDSTYRLEVTDDSSPPNTKERTNLLVDR